MDSKRSYSEERERSGKKAAVEESDSERSERESGERSSSSQESRGSGESSIAEQYGSERESGEQSSISDQSSGSPSVAQESDTSSTHSSPPKTPSLGASHPSSSAHSSRSSSGSSTSHSNPSKSSSLRSSDSSASHSGTSSSSSDTSFLDSTDEDFLTDKGYLITRVVGSGSFGCVYEAQDTQANQTVAIKVIKSGKAFTDLEIVDRVDETTQKLLEVRHHNIVTTHEYDRIDVYASQFIHRLYIVTEFAEMPDLFEAVIIQNALGNEIWWPLDEYQSRHMIKGMARGVNHMHENDMSHSDLKLDNVLLFWSNRATPQHRNTILSDILTRDRDKHLTYELVPKLTDFDKCKIRDDLIDPEGMIMEINPRSHENYGAPECYRGVAYDLIKADCYSLGCCLMAMLLASHPFDEPFGTEVPQDIDPNYRANRQIYLNRCNALKMDITYVKHLIKHMSLPLRRVLVRLLDPNSETRITISEFLADQWFSKSLEESYKTEPFTDFNRNYLKDF